VVATTIRFVVKIRLTRRKVCKDIGSVKVLVFYKMADFLTDRQWLTK